MRRAVAKAVKNLAPLPDPRSVRQHFFDDAPAIRNLNLLTSRFAEAIRSEGIARHICIATPAPRVAIALYGDSPDLMAEFASGIHVHSIAIELWDGDRVALLLDGGSTPIDRDRAARLHLLATMYATCAETLIEQTRDIHSTHSNAPPLSVNERLCLGLLLIGYSDAMIAERLGCGIRTVDCHIIAAVEKLGVRSRTEAVDLAARRGWLLADHPTAWKLVYISVN
jgi:DNA-binding CsgD family transcriptional regulator